MSYLIDTNVAIYLRDRDPTVRAKIDALGETVVLSIVSRIELEGGVRREPSRAAVRRARLDLMLAAIVVLPFDAAAADIYRVIVETAGYSRRKILDRMIAAQAIEHRATLVTMNAADFADIPNLKVLAW